MTKTATTQTKQTRSRRPWTPDALHLEIFERVRMLGEKQQEIALSLGINQSTVSRIVARVERWQSRATPKEAGRLTHGERLRTQTSLTFERNELLLASCLRMASRMESTTNYVHTTTRRQDPATREKITLCDEQLDSCGVAARFLRLAFRINMEQLKLVREEELPPLPPLSAEELHEEELGAAAAAAELAASLQQYREQFDENHRQDMEYLKEQERLKAQEEAERAELERQLAETGVGGQESGVGEEPVAGTLRVPSPADDHPPASDGSRSEPATHNLHNVHKANGHASAASAEPAYAYAETGSGGKSANATHSQPVRARRSNGHSNRRSNRA